MKLIKKIQIAIILNILITFFSCTKIEDLQKNPNKYSDPKPNLILTNLEIKAFNTVSLNNALASRYLSYVNGVNKFQYYSWQRSDFDNYYNLKQAVLLESEAKKKQNKAYLALSLFFKSYFIVEITNRFGDVPYTEAIISGNLTPKYDTQKSIFIKVLNDLKAASDILRQTIDPVEGDVIYKGDKIKWRKLINSYYLRVLMSLSKKVTDQELSIIKRFKEVVNSPTKYPIMLSNQDSGVIVYEDVQDNRYPFYNSNELKTSYYMEENFVNLLKSLKDPRLFSFAEVKTDSPTNQPNNFDSYGGLNGSAKLSDNTAKAVKGEASRINSRYFDDPINEPSILMSYSELQFILAEAVIKGWIMGNVDEYYKEGIKSSFEFYKIKMEDIELYLSSSQVQIVSGKELETVMKQKYISLFMNSGWLSFYEQRRTGFPLFSLNGGGVLNNGVIPKRWMYPESEVNNNKINMNNAIKEQSWSDDNINNIMWLIR